jgi:hypothetical protein
MDERVLGTLGIKLQREARKLGDSFPTCKDNRSYNIHIGIKLKTVFTT